MHYIYDIQDKCMEWNVENFYYLLSPVSSIFLACIGLWIAKNVTTKDKKTEIIRAEIQDKRDLFFLVSKMLSRRMFDYNRVFWAIEEIKSTEDINDTVVSRMNAERKVYYDTIRYYNINVRMVRQQLHFVFSEEISNKFFIDEEFNEKICRNPESIAGFFTSAHHYLYLLIRNIQHNKSMNYAEEIEELRSFKDSLSLEIDKFIHEISKATYSEDQKRYLE